jgi:uncharacterized membrane protein
MTMLPPLLTVLHLVGLSLAVGAATVKLTLLLRCRTDAALLQAYFAVARPVTKLIITGMVVLALSGSGWLLVAHDLTPVLTVKLVLFGCVFVLGPIIDNVAEPRFRRLAPPAGEAASPEFLRARTQYLALEIAATGLFYAIVVLWVLMA